MKNLDFCATGRQQSFLQPDWEQNSDKLANAYFGSRILVIGAAGSIGKSVTRLLATLQLSGLHVVDISENGLADLTRDLRISGLVGSSTDYKTFCIDVLSPQFEIFLKNFSYDYVFNLSALKHVRLEKDDYSLTRAMNVNIASHASILKNLDSLAPKGYFAVSTDKAACPANFMGLSKRLMEFHLLESELSHAIHTPIACARFANVAFSAGSLLKSWQDRIALKQPIVVPENTWRFFISHEEAAQICVLSMIMAEGRYVSIPADADVNRKKEMFRVATAFLQAHGLTPAITHDEQQALGTKPGSHYPLLLVPLDTAGEKEEEVFFEKGESITSVNDVAGLKIIKKESAPHLRQEAFSNLMKYLNETPLIQMSELHELAHQVCPAFAHISASKNLDEKI